MSERKESKAEILFIAVRTAIITVLITAAALLPEAVLLQQGLLPEKFARIVVSLIVFTAAFAVSAACRLGRAGGILETVPAALTALLILAVMGLSVPGARFRFCHILPVLAAAEAGFLAGAIMQFNKKYRKARRKRR